jgi:SurA N-terminal domain
VQRLALIFFGGFFILLFVAVGLAVGVGSSSPYLPPGAVAIVEDAPPGLGTISKAELAQEMRQQASFEGGKGVPQPGDEEYEQRRDQALNGLILAIWLQGQGEEMGIEVTDRQIAKKLQEGEEGKAFRENHYTQKTIDERVMKDLLVTLIQESLEEEVRKRLGKGASDALVEASQNEVFHEFDVGFRERWQPRTYCAEGFVIEQCGNYPAFAHSASSACYEADAEEPAEGCPAPVPSTLPALPGSVTELEPQGKQFVQRPFPEAE